MLAEDSTLLREGIRTQVLLGEGDVAEKLAAASHGPQGRRSPSIMS